MFLNFKKLKTLNLLLLTNKTFKTEFLYFYSILYLNKKIKTKKELLFFINIFLTFFFQSTNKYLKNKQFYRRFFINFYEKQLFQNSSIIKNKKSFYNFANKDYLNFFLKLNLLNNFHFNDFKGIMLNKKSINPIPELKNERNIYILNALRYLRLTRVETFDKIIKPHRFRKKLFVKLRKYYFRKKKKKKIKKKFKFFKRTKKK